MTPDLENEVASRVGLKIDQTKTEVASVIGHCSFSICSKEHSIEGIDQCVYPGSMVSTDGGI